MASPLIGELQIEAEDFTDCSFGEGKSENHQWIVVSDANSSSGLFLNAIPDNLVHMRDEKGPVCIMPWLTKQSNMVCLDFYAREFVW